MSKPAGYGYIPVRLPTGFCVEFGCGKQLKGDDGKRCGARDRCWKHLKQAQRSGDLIPMLGQRLPGVEYLCQRCGNACNLYLKLCDACYASHWRQTTPRRAAVLARQRARYYRSKGAQDMYLEHLKQATEARDALPPEEVREPVTGCSECGDKVRALGLCTKHYFRRARKVASERKKNQLATVT